MKCELKGHDEVVSAIVALPDKSGYVSGGMDFKIIFWVTASLLHPSNPQLSHLYFSPFLWVRITKGL